MMTESKTDIRNLSLEELSDYFKVIDEKPFRTTQVFEWIYQKNAWSFDEMKNLPAQLRKQLSEKFILKPFDIEKKEISEDGTTKFLFDLDDGQKIETVLIPTKTRSTVCVSTQVGCKFGCKFCASGIGGWKRNLTVAEILTQILHVQEEVRQSQERLARFRPEESFGRTNNHPNPLSHLVFMGIGEPLDNYENLYKAIRVINSPKAIGIGARRITVSTCGVIPKIKELANVGIQIELAISLHGFDNDSRNVLMPVNKKYPFNDLMDACREYIEITNRQITFEYILIKDITCTDEAIRHLRKAFKGMICKMNLIPYNPIDEFEHKTPSRQEMFKFRDKLQEFGVHATIRTPRGKDIKGACGQLRHALKDSSSYV